MTVVVAAAGALGRLPTATALKLMGRGSAAAPLEGQSAALFCLSFFQFSFSGSFY